MEKKLSSRIYLKCGRDDPACQRYKFFLMHYMRKINKTFSNCRIREIMNKKLVELLNKGRLPSCKENFHIRKGKLQTKKGKFHRQKVILPSERQKSFNKW